MDSDTNMEERNWYRRISNNYRATSIILHTILLYIIHVCMNPLLSSVQMISQSIFPNKYLDMTLIMIQLQQLQLWKIADHCLIYSALFLYYLFYFTDQVDSNKNTKRYIPKYKRYRRLKRVLNYSTCLISKGFNAVERATEKYLKTHSQRIKYKHMKNVARKVSTTDSGKNKSVHTKYGNRRCLLALSALAMSTQYGAARQNIVTFDTDSRPIGVDNRCTACISHDINDFIDVPTETERKIKGFAGTTHSNVRVGTIKWSWCDDEGVKHKFIIPNSYYVPHGNVRLLSPQHWAKVLTKGNRKRIGTGEHTNAHECVLYWNEKRNKLTIPLSPGTNVATFSLAHGYTKYKSFCHEAKISGIDEKDSLTIDETTLISDDDNEVATPPANEYSKDKFTWTAPTPVKSPTVIPLDGPHVIPPDKESKGETEHRQYDGNGKLTPPEQLLRYHQKMGHMSFQKLQILAEQGAIPKHLAKCDIPVCSSCMYSKMSKRPWRNKTRQDFKAKTPVDPGEVVSVDQMVSPTAGFIAQMTGILTKQRYKYATVYVDQATRFGYVHLQKTGSVGETLEGKKAFEILAQDSGISVKGYHADNGIFRANAWVNSCNAASQRLTFAGVNAHHQNGIAERRIKELQELARTMLIHAHNRWPKCVTTELWPYAIRAANEALNDSPSLQDPGRKSPAQLFHKTNVLANPKHYQPFGCPVYVLDNALQANRPIHKWSIRSRVGINLGHSPLHGKNVSLVLNRATGLVSPQFHVKYDPLFHSVKQDNLDSQWQQRAGLIPSKEVEQILKPIKGKSKPSAKTAQKKPSPQMHNSEGVGTPMQRQEGEAAQPKRVRWDENTRKDSNTDNNQVNDANKRRKLEMLQHEVESPQKAQERTGQINKTQTSVSTPQLGTKTRDGSNGSSSLGSSGSKIMTPQGPSIGSNTKVGQVKESNNRPNVIEAMMSEIMVNTKDKIEGEIFCLEALFPMKNNWIENVDPLFAFKATADPDTMYLHEAMREKDRDEFSKAMVKEVKDQMDNGNFTIIKATDVPKDKSILPAVWQMKRKRDIKTRKVKKWKARLNIDGSRMKHGVHYDQTYAPVASWKSIRLLLMLTIQNGWHSRQLDYVLAFPQAPVEKEIYMQVPKGFEIEGAKKGEYVLRLNRNVYGQKQAGRVWNKYLVDKLVNKVGFTQSKIDECVFYKGKTMYVLYTDDSLLAGPDKKEIDQIIEDIKKAKLNITDEGDIQDFLGINISMNKDKTVTLTQPHLIDQILKDVGMDGNNVKVKDTPASSSKILGRAKDEPDFDKSFNYRSVIGKLNYLEKGTRSDISYITHQCARFTEEPKECHAKAIRWLARYLRATRDKGLIMKPDASQGLNVFVDADFSGNWEQGDSTNRDTARSRHGYIICFMGCPVIWKSQLQTEIALSSTESEYIGLSYALREVIPIMELLKEMKKFGFPIRSQTPNMKCRVFEDNSGALEMANTHKYRPRTKHINVKFHHFRDYVTRGEITVHKIDTKDQCADYLTKPLNKETLIPLRRKVMGW